MSGPTTFVETQCCIVGAGPAGMILALLLARSGVSVTLLEAHADFDRDFRGDSLHPYTLELMEQLGLVEALLAIPHRRMERVEFQTARGLVQVADFQRLGGKYPYQAIMPQVDFLNFLAHELQRYDNATLRLRANVQELIVEGDAIRGVRYQDEGSRVCEVRAALTVGADGRHSAVRKLAGIQPVETSAPMDILWLRLPRWPDDAVLEQGLRVVFGTGHFCVLSERPGREWQIGYVMVKGTFSQLRAEGIGALRANLAALLPEFSDRIGSIQDFKHVAVLAAGSSFCPKWWKPGLLLIGDAAHVMSPVAGIGILHAIQDAVAAANVLAKPLLSGGVTNEHLAAVQRSRQFYVQSAQRLQVFIHRRVIAPALLPNRSDTLPWYLRWFFRLRPLGNRPSRWLAYGFRPPRWEGE